MKTRKLPQNIKKIVAKVNRKWVNMLNSQEEQNRERMREIAAKYKG